MGKIICTGLGPGDPELMSVRADRLIRGARHVAYFRKRGRPGQARRIVDGMLASGASEYPMEYPVTTELPFDSDAYNDALARFYDDWADRLAALACDGDVIVLCEGDPLFYGSFMHLHARLQDRVAIEIVPGITGMSGCWTAIGRPMAWGDDVLTVLMGTMSEDELARRIADSDAFAIMKVGANLDKIRRALARAGRADATLVERGAMPGQTITPLTDDVVVKAPYFAIVLAPGHGRRPQRRNGA